MIRVPKITVRHCGSVQGGHVSVPPQPLLPLKPHSAVAHVLGWQHDVPERHTEVPGQDPQFRILPQPSFTVPQTLPAHDAVGVQQVLFALHV